MIRCFMIISCLLVMVSCVSGAWTEHNFNGMINDINQLLPENLRWVLVQYAVEFETGKQPANMNLNEKQLIESILHDVDFAIESFTTGMSYQKGAGLLGQISRKIMSMHSLLHDSSELSNQTWQTDYAIFLQQHRKHFRIRWHGYNQLPTNRNQLQTMLLTSQQNTGQYNNKLVETLNKENKSIAEYDLMSIPFGIGSITYSNAVRTIAYTWLYVWSQAGGL